VDATRNSVGARTEDIIATTAFNFVPIKPGRLPSRWESFDFEGARSGGPHDLD
jgi:hypothetical protein